MKIIGFVSGCFDWMTPGHVTLFQESSKQCDELHVLVGDDNTVSYYKGSTRPVLTLSERLHILNSCRYVDMTHVLTKLPDFDNQFHLIKKINPDIYFEGPDRTDKDIQKYLDELDIKRVVIPINHRRLTDILQNHTDTFISLEGYHV